jgi:geranylgeranyl diphosphate synthase, type I
VTTAPPLTLEDRPAAPDALARARRLLAPALQAAAERLNPGLQLAVRHHLEGGGKYVRGGLVLLSAAAVGAGEQTALVGAVAIELVHNFSLVHDDIIDGDIERRHQSTVWAEFGVGQAIIAGDALLTLALQLLLESPTPARVAAAARLSEATQAMIGGQAEDMASEQRLGLSLEECLRMEAGKTGALLACAASLGAVLAGAPAAAIEALEGYGRHLGVAFQAIDDVLGIWGEPATTGKPVGNDLRLHKKTLPVAIACAAAHPPAGLASRLGGELSDADVAEAARLLEECGAREATMELAEAHLGASLDALECARLDPIATAELCAVARYVTARDR